MAHTRRTLQLNQQWDLALDGAGRIAVIDGAAATAQNVANEARLFTNDAYFNQDRGIPYFVMALGQRVNAAVLRSSLRQAALAVDDVNEVLAIEIDNLDPASRVLSGDIQFTTVADAAATGATNGGFRTRF